ncbi:MAG TPA: sugar ABC transporter permease [Mycobacteriales bacterium]|nr:sugar ABC transporter permease [Mycobacteriales bacterium]
MTDVLAALRTRRHRNKRQNLWALLFLGPWLIGVIVFTAGPMIGSLYLSFTDYDLLTSPKWTGLANFRRMFTADPVFLESLKVTAIYVAIGTPLELAVALLVAAALNKGLKGLNFYRSVLYLPSLFGGSVAIAVLWRRVFSSDGLVNQALDLIGIHGPAWISDPSYALSTLIVLEVWQFGAPMVIFLAGLRQIPQEYYDAASVDGAGRTRRFLNVTIPLLSPVIFFNLVLQIIRGFQAFAPAFIISNGSGGPVNSTLFYSLYLYQEGFVNFHMGYASAMAWFLLLIAATLTAINFLLGRFWVHYGD